MRRVRACLPLLLLLGTFSSPTLSSQRYEPEAPPQLYHPRCETTATDPDADCIFGSAGRDYPVLDQVPATAFGCEALLPGIYADTDTDCQVYHFCLHDGNKFSFLCPNGTMFNQAYFVCDLWFNVDCSRSREFYSLNENIYKNPNLLASRENTYA
ncbi:Chitin binding domain [Trinorchestia longiramus]|nr:Chitin binding domain [Trinorchestia longiramus]